MYNYFFASLKSTSSIEQVRLIITIISNYTKVIVRLMSKGRQAEELR